MFNRFPGGALFCGIIALFQAVVSIPAKYPGSDGYCLEFPSDTALPTHVYATICADERYIWNNQVLSEEGQYTDTLLSALGADSIVVLHLNILPVGRSEQFATICPEIPILWAGQTIVKPGVYCDTVTTLTGCDSLICLQVLLLDPSPVTMIGAVLCPGTAYNWNGRDYRQPGIYIKSYPSETGCDSIVELRIEVLNEIPVTIVDTVLHQADTPGSGRPGQWPENTRTDTLPSRFGCDSIVIRRVQY